MEHIIVLNSCISWAHKWKNWNKMVRHLLYQWVPCNFVFHEWRPGHWHQVTNLFPSCWLPFPVATPISSTSKIWNQHKASKTTQQIPFLKKDDGSAKENTDLWYSTDWKLLPANLSICWTEKLKISIRNTSITCVISCLKEFEEWK